MYEINVNFGTGRLIASGLRDDFLDGSAADLRPMDAAEFIPTGSHRFVPSTVKGSPFYYVFAERDRGNQF
jgi:hypothetical protein